MVKKILNCFVGINFLLSHILDSLQNTTKTSILNDTYSYKNLEIVCVKFFGKTRTTMVANLKSICQNLVPENKCIIQIPHSKGSSKYLKMPQLMIKTFHRSYRPAIAKTLKTFPLWSALVSL